MRILYIIAGILAVLLALMGAVLPVIPAIPFWLAAFFCFNKGSPRFHQWILSTKIYQKYFEKDSTDSGMRVKTKLLCTIGITMTMTILFFLAKAFFPAVRWGLLFVWLLYTICIWFIIKTKK
ncbi:MAG: YbaN family protein [Clostridiales bacterium]|nr:YbaN family protein [Clostridiales bacterium]